MTVRIEDLKVGMKVKLVDREPKYIVVGGFDDGMRKYLGKVCTVVLKDSYGAFVLFKEDRGCWRWDISLIEKIIDDKEKKNKVYRSLKEIKENSIEGDYYRFKGIYWEYINRSYELDKCIVNNNCVIGIFRYGTQTYKGIAKCHPGDEFSLAKGLTIAMLRAHKNYLDREIKKLY